MDQKQFKELKRTIAGGALFLGGVLLLFVSERLGIVSCTIGIGLMFIDSLLQVLSGIEEERNTEQAGKKKE